jgi:SAM-dependent methyltransferase
MRYKSLALHCKRWLASIFRQRRKIDFLNRLPPRFELLDVGCGSNSPYMVKSLFPDCVYTGIDVSDHRQSQPNLADYYVLADPSRFAEAIRSRGEKFDAVISSHNLEHCDDRAATLDAMMAVLKIGGRLYLSFPSEATVKFPSRAGCLNYYDDPTHQSTPPDFKWVIETLKQRGFSVLYSVRQYQPSIFWALGFLSESISKRRESRMRGTWEYYGFESIIWAEKGRKPISPRPESVLVQ